MADSLVKSMGAKVVDADNYDEVLVQCLARNFSGLPVDEAHSTTARYFLRSMRGKVEPVAAISLIQQNLVDRDARHLLVATKAGSALQILEDDIRGKGRPLTVIHGSQFESDQSPDYSYRILSQIILCMERGGFVVLRDLDIIYGSLYDMLNQNYTVVGGKRNCRVALGADSNPMCHVADDFRCIVIMDTDEVTQKDPPFLNRFEKQCVSYDDILQGRPRTRELITELRQWVKDVSTVLDMSTNTSFTPADAFLGFHENTLPSLVLKILGKDAAVDEWDRKDLQMCKEHLLWTASEDMITRIYEAELDDKHDTAAWCEHVYYEEQVHSGLTELLKLKRLRADTSVETGLNIGEMSQSQTVKKSTGMRLVVMTFTSVYENPAPLAEAAGLKCRQGPSLGAYKAEAEFVQRMEEFWKDDEQDLYVLQINAATDAKHVLLAKSRIEERWTEHHNKRGARPKHVLIMVHVDREPDATEAPWQFNYLSGWDLVTLDSLQPPQIDIKRYRDQAIEDAFKLSDVDQVMREEISTCFYEISYPARAGVAQHIRTMVEQMSKKKRLVRQFLSSLP